MNDIKRQIIPEAGVILHGVARDVSWMEGYTLCILNGTQRRELSWTRVSSDGVTNNWKGNSLG
jgi:hypothetical protein